MKNLFRRGLCAVFALCLALGLATTAFADSPTDEILKYEITAEVNDDASVDLYYHFEWEVLESDGIGPVEWLTIGIPNGKQNEIKAISDNIKSAEYDSSNGNNVRIDFTKSYYEGEVISFDFMVQTDYMYQMNAIASGSTVYYFTPGWFDEITVDSLVIKWNADKADSWTGGALQKDGYLTWETSLEPGATMSVEVIYPNDAFAFTESSNDYNSGNYYYDGDYSDGYSSGSALWGLISGLFSLMPIFIIVFIIIVMKKAKKNYDKGAGFASGETKTKVTRTKVVYFDSCPGCGAPRGEGKEVCEFCGRSLIKSEEIIKEEEVPDEDKEALNYDKAGTYHYGPDPNTFVRVNVVHIPVVVPHVSTMGGRSGGGGGGRSGGCAHSSCACACVSCACACACACAGGGRAGCSTKDMYSSKLKASQIKKRKK